MQHPNVTILKIKPLPSCSYKLHAYGPMLASHCRIAESKETITNAFFSEGGKQKSRYGEKKQQNDRKKK